MTSGNREVRWERMFRDELEAELGRYPTVYFAYGLCEPHGPHNALGLDTLKAYGICCSAARRHGGIVAPPDYWHVHEVGFYGAWAAEWIGDDRPWLTAVPPWVHFKNVAYHLRAADALGFKAALLVTGHYGPNWVDLNTVIEILQPHFRMRIRGLPDWEANVGGFNGDATYRGDHAGKVETSLLWALEPESVDMQRLPDRTVPGPHFAMGPDAHEADRDAGEAMVEGESEWLGRTAADLMDEFDGLTPIRDGALSFLELEHIWRTEIEPLVPTFASMQRGDLAPPPPESQWSVNYPSTEYRA